MPKISKLHLMILLAVLILPSIGCDSDDPVIPDPAGTLMVDPSPDAIAAPWTLTGPGSYSKTAAGDQTLSQLSPGDYTITWADVDDWATPGPETRTLIADAIETFEGVYIGQLGTIEISSAPVELNALWQLLGPPGFSESGLGSATLTDMPIGEYWVSWGPVAGWIEPDGYSQTLIAAEPLVFAGTYTEVPAPQFADTESKLMENFRRVYQEMEFEYYEDMLDPKFIMLLQAATQTDFPDVGEFLDLAEELEIASKMFSGESGLDSQGNWEAPISSIEMQILHQQTGWSTTPANDVIPNAEAALFDVKFMLFRPGFTTLQVEGTLQFFIARQDSFHDGAVRDYWRMVGMQDFTGAGLKAGESNSWGSVKAMYR